MMKDNEYRAETFRIFGLSVMAPFGKVILALSDLKFEEMDIQLVIYFVISLILVLFGIILIQRGYAILVE
ncbi:MAG: hypothetical protein HY094_08120 [Candidatus Melainabacteria bacterium]|nr:hypothetical protein [Candidatus Melainabacteria bacterium]